MLQVWLGIFAFLSLFGAQCLTDAYIASYDAVAAALSR
jgi:hypothetical protein